MDTATLSDKEMGLYKQVTGLNGTIEYKYAELERLGTFTAYHDIFIAYLEIAKTSGAFEERIEALKRMLFLNWYQIMEPGFLTGIGEFEERNVKEMYSVLNRYIENNIVDGELEWMISFYARDEWIVLNLWNGSSALTAFVKGIDQSVNHVPESEVLTKTMNDRGQMGLYFCAY